MEKKEIWENRTKSSIWVTKTNSKGETDSVHVLPGTKLDISSEDRRLNQEIAFSKSNDWFSNGVLSPATLVETAEDYAQVKANPNTLSEKEVFGLLDLTGPKLKAALAEIDSPLVLQTLNDYVNSEEAEKADGLTMAKVNAVKTRYEELNPRKTGVKVSETIEEVLKKPIQGN